ncbi:hypothetical protein Noc_1839 [Nitrosococcus oceani ATCC 19707]|uniref:Uncharacterized protein n=1 Tax=Nitrosococcus oceani (strain ATCC 19707 / BCRC 17464 / JCM 30415 / NCIMB 11848 / C-107) TaxID=323261 RepID=Q3JA39_NITOC|nr:hypothetical protein [Nitrosococcus oceani]ABA58307.1 hypothetical protein Noc_1839 [Nitrosococcus oceani ATCC 19707]
MTDFNFVPTNLHPPGECAAPRSLRRKGFLGLRWFALLLAHSLQVLSTLGSVNKRVLPPIHGKKQAILALPLDTPFHFACLRACLLQAGTLVRGSLNIHV